MRNYKLDTSLLPKVWVTWTSTKNGLFNKRYWLNCQTGKKKDKPEDWMIYNGEGCITTYHWRGNYNFGCTYQTEKNDNIWVASGSKLRYAYIKYHKDIDRIEVAAVGIDTSRKAEPRKWEYLGDRYFIGKDKSIVNDKGEHVSRFYLFEYHSAYNPSMLLSMLFRLHCNNHMINEFKKLIGGDSFTISNGRCVIVENTWHIQEWYKTSQVARKAGKQQQLTDQLVAMSVMDSSDFAEKYQPMVLSNSAFYNNTLNNFIHFERINDEWCVLRAFYRHNDNITEQWRMYISEDGVSRIVAPSDKGWIPSRQIHARWSRFYIANEDEAIEKCNRIKYILNSTDDIDVLYRVDFLVTALRFPEIEQLVKFGYVNEAKGIISSSTPKAEIKYKFGGYFNEKEKNLLRRVGLTKPQFDYYMSQTSWRVSDALKAMRKMFGNDLSYMDIDSFKKYYNGHLKVCECCWRGINSWTAGLDMDTLKFFKNLCRLGEKRENAVHLASDTMNAYRGLNMGTAPEIDWYFEDYSDLVRAHDAIMELKRIQDEERRATWDADAAERRKKEEAKRKKVDEERKCYEYEDDNYIIRLPEDLNEIIREGNYQHICIGGYTSRHALGETNLFFLREKNEPNSPFYAIEMNNNKHIVQIHGFGNKWLGNNPEAIPAVVRWLRKNDIKCKNDILTCKAKGYSSCNDYVPMPIVD